MTSVVALTHEQIVRMAAEGQDPSRFSYRVWQQAVRQLLEEIQAAESDAQVEASFEVGGALDELQRLGQEFDRANTTAEGETSG